MLKLSSLRWNFAYLLEDLIHQTKIWIRSNQYSKRR